MSEQGRLFLGARQRRARRLLQRRIGWVVGSLAGALLACLIALAVMVRKVHESPPLPTALLLPVTVEVTEQGFRPSVIIVQPGVEVRWAIKRGRHKIVDLAESWEGESKDGGVFIRTMPVAGESTFFLDYECRLHGRQGSIHILPAPVQAPGGGI